MWTDTLAQSYLPMTSQTTGAAAEAAADRKTAKYAPLTQSYLFVPIAVETIIRVGKEFLSDLGKRITQMTNEKREGPSSFNGSRWSSNGTTRSPSRAPLSSHRLRTNPSRYSFAVVVRLNNININKPMEFEAFTDRALLFVANFRQRRSQTTGAASGGSRISW